MTITSTATFVEYVGNGSLQVFHVASNGQSIYFEFADELIVSVDGIELEISTDYTVSGAGAESGATITLLTAPAVDAVVRIERSTRLVNELDLSTNGPFKGEDLERALDRNVRGLQDIERVAVDATQGVSDIDESVALATNARDEAAAALATINAALATATTAAANAAAAATAATNAATANTNALSNYRTSSAQDTIDQAQDNARNNLGDTDKTADTLVLRDDSGNTAVSRLTFDDLRTTAASASNSNLPFILGMDLLSGTKTLVINTVAATLASLGLTKPEIRDIAGGRDRLGIGGHLLIRVVRSSGDHPVLGEVQEIREDGNFNYSNTGSGSVVPGTWECVGWSGTDAGGAVRDFYLFRRIPDPV